MVERPAADATTFEIGEARLRLRDGLRFSLRQNDGAPCLFIEDESQMLFYRLGLAEYTFISLLDGTRTVATALSTACSASPGDGLTEHEATELCHWLVEAGLAETPSSRSARRILQAEESASKAWFAQWLNPISLRIPLFSPDRLLTRLEPYLRWLVSWPAFFLWLVVCGMGALSVMMEWSRFSSASLEVFSRDHFVYLGVTWLLLKGIHEFAHAFVCKRFGGRVGACGMVLLLLVPLPYVDVSSAWRFTSKRQRILVSAAGMLAELFVAAMAALVWSRAEAGVFSYHAKNVVLTASLHTLLFNLNPLMRFDGYHILVDTVGLPNLGRHGQAFVRDLGRRFLLGLPTSRSTLGGWRRILVACYGIGAACWKILLTITLTVGAANLLPGVGLLLATVGIILWLALPTIQLIRYLVEGTPYEQPNRRRFATVVAGLTASLIFIGTVLPAPTVISAPCLVEYEPIHVIRAEASGFVREVLVEPGNVVRLGDPLMRLENAELTARLSDLECQLTAANLRANEQLEKLNSAAYQAAQAAISALEQQVNELGQQQRQLTVRSAATGVVIGDDLQNLSGSYLQAGMEVLSIATEEEKEVVALVTQRDAQYLSAAVGRPVDIRIRGSLVKGHGTVRSVEPRLQNEVPHYAFAGTYGGPLDVIRRQGTDNEQDAGEAWMLL
ncbi:MAG: efflux RND transporter periplasmic adaptor subunit, partial [Planctomycetales bacterium]|nr:efflux RND transporter periplasmic adaptor subunit [Planctomycetales bacterium]